MLFVAKHDDNSALKALGILKAEGFSTQVLSEQERAENGAVAIFSLPEGSHARKRGHYLRTSSVRLQKTCPNWALSTCFLIGVIRTQNTKQLKFPRKYGFEASVVEMAKRYERWFTEGSREWTPWEGSKNDPRLKEGAPARGALEDWFNSKEVEKFRTINLILRPSSGITVIRVGEWDVNCCKSPRVFGAGAVTQALKLLNRWQDVFAKENTWVQGRLKVPSLIVRLDCIVEDGELVVYEVEERPAGVGISSIINREFGQEFLNLAQHWEPFSVVISPLRRATDDSLWQAQLPWQKSKTGLVLVRAEPEEQSFHIHESHSVSSLKRKGDKGYGEKLGLWRKVKFPDELNWDESFVLKPLQGSKLKDLEIWDPKRRPGSSKREVVEDALAKSPEGMFCQKLYPPMQSGIERFPWMIFRVLFGYDPLRREWKALGGNWNARHNLRIHGASDAIFGPAVLG